MSLPTEGMSCGEVEGLLEAHLDGDLGRDQSRAVTAHLAECPACAAEAQLAGRVRAELRALPELDAPAAVLASVRWSTGSRRPGRSRPILAVAAAVVAAVGLGLLWLDRSRPSLDDPEVARATAEARYALALVGAVGRRAALDELLGERVLSPALEGLVRSLRRIPEEHRDGPPVAEENEIEHQGGTE